MFHLFVLFEQMKNYNFSSYEWLCDLRFRLCFKWNCQACSMRCRCDGTWLILWRSLCVMLSHHLHHWWRKMPIVRHDYLRKDESIRHCCCELHQATIMALISLLHTSKKTRIWIDPKKAAYSISMMPLSDWDCFLIKKEFVS